MLVRFAVALVVVLFAFASASAALDPSRPGPHAVGYSRAMLARQDTRDGSESVLDVVVWYPAVVGSEPLDALGYREPPIRHGRHPLLVYSHGGCAFPEVSSFLTKALASWGFVVVAPSHPGDTAFDGFDSCDFDELRAATLVQRVADVRAVVDALEYDGDALGARFAGRVSRGRIGVLGWSSGGSTAIVAAREDPRIRAALSLAPDARPERIGTRPIRVPTMVMGGELDYYDPEQIALDLVYEVLRPPRFAVHLRRTGHFAFSDDCFADLVGGEDCRPGALTQDEAHALVLRFALPFLLRWVDEDRRWDAFLRPESATATTADATLRAQPPRPDRVAIGR